MSAEHLWERVQMAWAMLAGRPAGEVRPDRERVTRPPAPSEPEAGAIAAEGFAEEALPWMDAVLGFALRLTRGDRDEAEDLVQETFLRAHRFWDSFERGTNAKSWLFTICRNTYLHGREKAINRYEKPAADFDAHVETLAAVDAWGPSGKAPDRSFFDSLIDDKVIEAIDELPEEFREVLVLSDLGDLKYAEIAEVLDVPVGTVKSRLFRARRILQDRLRSFATEAGYVREVES
ncbi:MAG: sigma-70 family RNA polymerase sigma factor [Gemmatimonadota bacterium]|nr:sigma-70 family RNA polymerase sigma factor [Gemmatimonadota bacterium]